MTNETVKILRHILDTRVDNAWNYEVYVALCNIRDIMEYAIADNIECLRQFDYLLTKEEQDEEEIDDAAIAMRESASL